MLEALAPENPGDTDDDVVPDEAPARVRLGDIWKLGHHRLICGDALDPAVVAELMDGDVAQMVFSDPPYTVPIDGHVGNSGKIQHRNGQPHINTFELGRHGRYRTNVWEYRRVNSRHAGVWKNWHCIQQSNRCR